MRNKFICSWVVAMVAIVLCASVAEASFWSRLFGKEKKEETVVTAEAGTTATEAQTPTEVKATTAGAGGSSMVAAGLDVQTALATVESVKGALASISANGSQLRALLGDKPDLLSLLDKALDAAKKGDDLLALDSIKEIGEAASLTAEQSKLVDSLKKDFEILALGRNFPEDGPVSDAIAQLKSGDYSKALGTLGDMAKDSTLTQQQRSILNKVIQQYAGDLKRLLPF